MFQPPSSPQTETLLAKTPSNRKLTKATQTGGSKTKAQHLAYLGHAFAGVWAVLAAIATANQSSFVDLLERQLQTLFFEIRGPVSPPEDIVILAMDADTLIQGTQIYPTNPQKYAYLESIGRWPWQRTAYAIAVEKLMEAGAKAVAVDVLLDAPSSYSAEDDERLRQTLTKYTGKIALAAKYETAETQQGRQSQLITPNALYQPPGQVIGFINLAVSPDGRLHTLGSEYVKLEAQKHGREQAAVLDPDVLSLPEATLKAAQISLPQPRGHTLFFHGPAGTFKQIPFWQVLDPDPWNNVHLKHETFKDKIVLIGSTAADLQDFHAAPFSGSLVYPHKMTGVEVLANAIATLKEKRAIADAIPNVPLQGLFTLAIILGAAYGQTRAKRPVRRLACAIGLSLGWGTLSYFVFTQALLILPTAVPMVAIVLAGTSYLFTGIARDKLNLRRTIKQYASSPIVQELISSIQQDDLQDLLQERQQELSGKYLQKRYRIARVLGSGGFGETYVAEDTQRPGNPTCVVKRLRPASNSPRILNLAGRMFRLEAETLEKLGTHDQIPRLLAYFEEDDDFFLVQDFIAGQPLSQELLPGKQLSEMRVVFILRELLQILEFVHSQGVIHRDIKPSNIIQREYDHRLVLIDFGAVKEIHQIREEEATTVTVGIGTQGYMPSEQCEGKPRLNSDIYAVGMTGIQALTGLPPGKLKEDLYTGEIAWEEHRPYVSRALAEILNKMVQRDFRKRYQSVTEVLQDLNSLAAASLTLSSDMEPTPDISNGFAGSTEENTGAATSTKPWPETFGSPSQSLPVTELPPNQ